jgi:hypothetical protein
MKIFESTFPQTFRQAEIKQILDFVTKGRSCQLVCVPGAGKATVLRLLAHNRELLRFHLGEKEKPVRFIYLNLLELPGFDEAQISKFILISIDDKAQTPDDHLVLQKLLNEAVNGLAVQNQTLILLFDHFDEYQNRLPRSFFQMLRNFKDLARYKFAAVFASRRDLAEIIDPEILKEFYDFFTDNAVYLKIYDKDAADLLFSQTESVFEKKIPEKTRQDIIKQTSGHAKLTKVIAELILKESVSPAAETLLAKPIIHATLQELWLFLTPREQQVLSQIINSSKPQEDEALLNLVNLDLLSENLTFTIPLLEEFVKTAAPAALREKITYDSSTREIHKGASVISELLSRQEYRLLKFLIENQNRLVGRDEIITAVWPDVKVKDGISDEAIDQMIFRLRKKIEDTPNSPKHLITVKGQGLRFEP